MSKKGLGLFMILTVFLSAFFEIADTNDLIIYFVLAAILHIGVLLFTREGE